MTDCLNAHKIVVWITATLSVSGDFRLCHFLISGDVIRFLNTRLKQSPHKQHQASLSIVKHKAQAMSTQAASSITQHS
jgi:uncharacterized protein YegL